MFMRIYYWLILLNFFAANGTCFAQNVTINRNDFPAIWTQFLEIYGNILTEENRRIEFELIKKFTHLQKERLCPNSCKGRYSDACPYHDNQIILSNGTILSASPVQFLSVNHNYHSFIAAQAPIPETIDDFWQMIVEKKVDQIVMLTDLTETRDVEWEEVFEGNVEEKGEILLAHLYWPDQINETYELQSGWQIIFLDKKEYFTDLVESIEIRKFRLQRKGEEDRLLTHYWFRHWIDGSVPREEKVISDLLFQVCKDKELLGTSSPIVVHCSAGVGRSGVFITLYHFMQRAKNKDEQINFFDFVGYLRWQRVYLLGNFDQYLYCDQVISSKI